VFIELSESRVSEHPFRVQPRIPAVLTALQEGRVVPEAALAVAQWMDALHVEQSCRVGRKGGLLLWLLVVLPTNAPARSALQETDQAPCRGSVAGSERAAVWFDLSEMVTCKFC
jgi:hypothetical protein